MTGQARVTSEEIRRFVEALLGERGDRRPVGEDEPLLSAGRLDSVAVMEIVAFLEDRGGIDFAAAGFDPAEFDTLRSIAAVAAG